MRLRKRTWAYLGLITLVAVGVLAYWQRAWPGPLSPDWLSMALFVALAVLAQHAPLPVAPQRKVDASAAAYFASLLLFGAAAAVLIVAISQLIGQATLSLRRNPASGRRRRAPPDVVFNTSQLVLATGIGAVVYYASIPAEAPAPLDQPANVLALPAAAATIYLVNSAAVAVIAGLQLGSNPVQVWLSGRWTYTLEFAGLFLCGLVTAMATIRFPWAPLPMLFLTAIVFRSLQTNVELLTREQGLRAQAQEAAENVRHLQEANAREHATLAAVLASMSDGLLLLDEVGQVRYCNAQASVLLGTRPETIVKQGAVDVIRRIAPALADPATAIAVWERIVAGQQGQVTGQMTLIEPTRRDVLVSAFRVAPTSHASMLHVDPTGDASLGLVLRDVTTLKQLARWDERERIAMDLHDGAIQALYGLGLTLSARERTLGGDVGQAREALRTAVRQIDDIIQGIRDSIFELQSRERDDGGLRDGLAALAEELRFNARLHPTLELDPGAECGLGPEAAANVLRIAREVTSNIIRHAGASEVAIRLERAGDDLVLTITDNGKGFELARDGGRMGHGLRNLTERARLLGGQVTISSAPGAGTRVRLEIPIIPGENG